MQGGFLAKALLFLSMLFRPINGDGNELDGMPNMQSLPLVSTNG
jgi:hypothetical protein